MTRSNRALWKTNRTLWILVILFALGWLVWLNRGESSPSPTTGGVSQQSAKRNSAKEVIADPGRTLAGTPTSVAPAANGEPACELYAKKACYAGDVYWFDSCDHVLDLDEDCNAGVCRGGKCIARDWTSACTEPPQGRCAGNKLVFCDLGKTVEVDCTAKNKVCAFGSEGAGCFAVASEKACSPGPARCEGRLLQSCVEGSRKETDCRQSGGACVELPGKGATCTEPLPPLEKEDEEKQCGACGCPSTPNSSTEECNGEDDDDNGYIDDAISCGEVKIDVLVGSGAHGEALIDAASLEQEIDVTNQIFADSGSQIQFRLGDVGELPLSTGDSTEIDDLFPLLESLKGPKDGEEFHVSLVFLRTLVEGGVPRLGVQLPFVTNGCGQVLRPGGRRYDRALIAIAERRVATTLAHELGHLLGLCHTHERPAEGAVPVVVSGDDEVKACGEQCTYGGDAICDTPDDDQTCTYNPRSCVPSCPQGQNPDTTNIMSYYHACRSGFSKDQVRLMEHTLALRRSWFLCREGACHCTPGDSSCPIGMSCRPGQAPDSPFLCGMDGPRLPGAVCDGKQECSLDSLCFTSGQRSQCARACAESTAGCSCTPTGTRGIAICREDMQAASQ